MQTPRTTSILVRPAPLHIESEEQIDPQKVAIATFSVFAAIAFIFFSWNQQ
jgi:hypothetical protein